MKIRLLILAFMIPFLGFSQIDKNDFVFERQNNNSSLWISIASTLEKFTPTIEEIGLVKQLSKNHIDSLERNRNPKTVKEYDKLLKFNDSDYFRQYVGYIDSKGNRIVFINSVCKTYGQKRDFKRNWIFVLDGGSCFYQIKVDLTAKKCFDFSINGEA
jgi:hypothetical protein